MRRIITAISGAALALSLVAQAVPANAAVAGYDSSYAGESAFLTLTQGSSGTFTVFFLNTGATAWTRGTSTQVDLAACLGDKTTCNAQDATEAPFNSGWLSATKYATSTQTSVAPGQVGTFSYNVAVPAAQAAGTYRFNGALLKADTNEDIRNEGYYQDVTVPGPGAPSGQAATLTGLTPTQGDTAGGTSVVLSGTNFVCTPSTPTVTFDTSTATVTSCGSTSLTVTTPAHAAGNVEVRVTNSGGVPSNALLFTYRDLTAPTYDSVNPIAGTNLATLNFSESVCRDGAFAAGDYAITVNNTTRTAQADGATTTNCGTTTATGTTSFNVSFNGDALVSGDFVIVTITTQGAAKIEDVAGTAMAGAQTRSGTAAADTARPSMSSAAATTTTNIRVTYNEPVKCGDGNTADAAFLAQFRAITGTSSLTPTSATCPASSTFGSTQLTLTFGANISAGGSVSYTESTDGTKRVKDVAGNRATSPQVINYAVLTTTVVQRPTITSASQTNGTGFTGTADSGDQVVLVFSEKMDTTNVTNIRVRAQDNDSPNKSVGEIACATIAVDTNELIDATCTWNAAGDTLTMLLQEDSDAGETIVDGTQAGLQWPATIIDTAGLKDEDGNSVDLTQSSDLVIN